MINFSFQSGVFPSCSKISQTLPLYKNGANDQFRNYRPTSTLHVISKVVEKTVYNKFADYLSESKLVPMRQFGLRAKRSTHMKEYL